MGNVCSCWQCFILCVSKRATSSNPWYFWCPSSVCISHLRVFIHGPWRNLWLLLNTVTSAEVISRNMKTLVWCLFFAFPCTLAFLPVAEYPLLPSGSCLWRRLLSSVVSHQVLASLLYRWKSHCMLVWTWRKAICSRRKTSVNFVSNPFSGAGPTPKNPHSHKKLARSQNSPCSQLAPAPVV